MEQMLTRLQSADPLAAGTLADALAAGRRLAIGGQMRAAADRLGQFQLGESMQHQQSARPSQSTVSLPFGRALQPRPKWNDQSKASKASSHALPHTVLRMVRIRED